MDIYCLTPKIQLKEVLTNLDFKRLNVHTKLIYEPNNLAVLINIRLKASISHQLSLFYIDSMIINETDRFKEISGFCLFYCSTIFQNLNLKPVP